MSRSPRPLSLAAAAGVLALALTACGSGSVSDDDPQGSGSAPAGAEGLTKVSVGVLPIAPSVAVHYGIEKGIFEEHGFDVELSTSTGGAAMLPAVSNQQLQFGVGNPMSVMNAVDRGLDMRMVSGYTYSHAEGDDVAGVFAQEEAGIDDWTDLEGKTVAVNALRTQGDLTIMEAVEQAGGDPTRVNFSEMPFPDMPAQLERGNVDAVWAPEPFVTMLGDTEGVELVGYNFQDSVPGMPSMVTFTSGALAEKDPEMVAEFREAMGEALEAASENEDEARGMLEDFIDMDPAVAEAITVEDMDGELRRDVLDATAELMHKFEFISAVPAAEDLYVESD